MDAKAESAEIIRQSKLAVAQSKELKRRSDTIMAITKLLGDTKKKCVVKTCKCGLVYRPSEWYALPFVGYQYEVEGIRGEMRNCKCNSTLFFVTFKASPEEMKKISERDPK